jgi:hypothetical protein
MYYQLFQVSNGISKSKSNPDTSSPDRRQGAALPGSRSSIILNGLTNQAAAAELTNGNQNGDALLSPQGSSACRVTGNKPPKPVMRPAAIQAEELARPPLSVNAANNGHAVLSPAPKSPPTQQILNGGMNHLPGLVASQPFAEQSTPPMSTAAYTPGAARRFSARKFAPLEGQPEAYNTYKAVMGSKEFFRVGTMDR